MLNFFNIIFHINILQNHEDGIRNYESLINSNIKNIFYVFNKTKVCAKFSNNLVENFLFSSTELLLFGVISGSIKSNFIPFTLIFNIKFTNIFHNNFLVKYKRLTRYYNIISILLIPKIVIKKVFNSAFGCCSVFIWLSFTER